MLSRRVVRSGLTVLLTLSALAAVPFSFAQNVLTTIAGTDWLFPADGHPALNAPLSGFAFDVTTDRNGNYYVCDYGNFMVFRVGRDGIINVIAGTGINFFSGDAGLAVNAGLDQPQSIARDAEGNIYIGGVSGNIRLVTPDGLIYTFAGAYGSGFSGDGGQAFDAEFANITGLAVDGAGNVYVADSDNARVRKITPDGIVRTIAGGGTGTKDGIPATQAKLTSPTHIAVDAAGNVYFSDLLGHSVRKIDTAGIITTVVGGNGDGEGIAANTAFVIPAGIALDPAGNLYLEDTYTANLRKVDTKGVITSIAGNGKADYSGDGGPALKASFRFGNAAALALDSAGSFYIADDGNNRIRRLTPDGKVATIAGNGLFHFSGNNGLATAAALDLPSGVTGDKAGNIYFAETFVNRVRKVSTSGIISVAAGNGDLGFTGDGGPATAAELAYPYFLAFAPDGSLAFSDYLNCIIRSVDPSGNIKTIAGIPNQCEYSGELTPALQTGLNFPQGIDYDPAGDLLIADTLGHRLQGVIGTGTNAGKVITLAGNGKAGYSGDGKATSNSTQINSPHGLRYNGNGVYFCDTGNNVIRYIDFDSFVITTVAGNGRAGYTGDGGRATRASLNNPRDLAFDSKGNMYIADTLNWAIRKVDTAGNITTIAGGLDEDYYYGDGYGADEVYIGAPAGLYVRPNGNIVFTDLRENRIHEIRTTLPTYRITPTSLAFTAAAGSAPLDQTLSFTGAFTGVPFALKSNSPWLTVSAPGGQMPADIRVTVDPSKLSAGTYSGTVTLTSGYATPGTASIPVSLTVTAPGQPSLSVNPSSLTFTYVQKDAARSRPVTVSNAGGGTIAFTVTTRTTAGGNWLQVATAATTLNAYGSAPVNITANPGTLSAGTYSGVVTISSTSPAQSVSVPVTMTVSSVLKTIVIPETGLSFFAAQDGGQPPSQNIDILNSGTGQMPWSITTSTTSGGDWLFTFPTSGTTDAASAIVPQARVYVDPYKLAPGTYYGSVQVTAPGASNSPQIVTIIFTVFPPGTDLGPIVQPAGMIFTGVAGGEAPGAAAITVQNTKSVAVTFTSGLIAPTAPAGNKGVFRAVPEAGTLTGAQPQRIVIQPDTKGLAPGIYRGTLTLSFSDGNTRAVSFLMVLIPPAGGTVTPKSLRRPQSFRDAQTSCKPTTLAPLFTGLAAGSSLPVGYPGHVLVAVIDDCANPMTTGGVTTTFSNGDAPLRLTSLKNGSWAGTWTPRTVSSSISVSALASIPEQSLSGSAQIRIGSSNADPLPVIDPDGIVNAASFASQAPLAPGSLVSLFGSKLSQGLSLATTLPLPSTLGGATLIIGGKEAPLLFTSDGQVNAVIPYGIPANTSQQAIASRNTSISVPRSITIAPAAPGVFTRDGKQAIVVDADSTGKQFVVDAAHPAVQGHALVIYCTGLGEVDQPVATGTPAPSNPLAGVVNPVSVTIGGQDAKVLFAGLTPTQVGLYQINVIIPNGITPGAAVPIVVTAAGQVSPTVTIALQ